MLRRNITPSIIILSFVARIYSWNEAKPVLIVFHHVEVIENRAATRREALPNFHGKTATIILADKNYR